MLQLCAHASCTFHTVFVKPQRGEALPTRQPRVLLAFFVGLFRPPCLRSDENARFQSVEAGLKADLKLANEERGLLRTENEKLVAKVRCDAVRCGCYGGGNHK